jgi:hypothetical protein
MRTVHKVSYFIRTVKDHYVDMNIALCIEKEEMERLDGSKERNKMHFKPGIQS